VWGEDLSGSLQGAGGIGGLLRSVNITANRELRTENTFHYDSNGNVILLTDTQGRESARYAYDAFGKTLTATGSAARGNRYRFSTKPVEEESGLVYYGYRYYDPVTGRWPSRDPLGELGGINLFLFVNNCPLQRADAFGLVDFQKHPTGTDNDYGGQGGGAGVKIVKLHVDIEQLADGECKVSFSRVEWRFHVTLGNPDLYQGPGFVNGFNVFVYNQIKDKSNFEKYKDQGLSYEGVRRHEMEHIRQLETIKDKIELFLGTVYGNVEKLCSCAEAPQLKAKLEGQDPFWINGWEGIHDQAFPAKGGFAAWQGGEFEAVEVEFNYYKTLVN
jgi:RHS repeat-associated protein